MNNKHWIYGLILYFIYYLMIINVNNDSKNKNKIKYMDLYIQKSILKLHDWI